MYRFEASIAASQGVRRNQEDSAQFRVINGALVAVLADGMGGHAGGAMASSLVCDVFVSTLGDASGPIADCLNGALYACNAAVAARVRETPSLFGMGSTLVGIRLGPDGLHWISVGDSPLYLYRRAEIALLNEDHSLAPALDQLAAEGKISVEAARNDPRRHMLRSAITGEELDLVDVSRTALPLQVGDYVVVASDGIHTIDEEQVAMLISRHADKGPDAIAAALIRAVSEVRDPHQDNVTVVVARILAETAPSS